LPKNAETLRTSCEKARVDVDWLDFNNGTTKKSRAHFGVKQGLEMAIKLAGINLPEDKHIKINLFVDGMPLSKTSQTCFWPLLMTTSLDPNIVHIVTLFYGDGEPTAEILLNKAVDEINEMNGYFNQHPIEIGHVVGDIPAICLCKVTKVTI
jgi:hypothetical protein